MTVKESISDLVKIITNHMAIDSLTRNDISTRLQNDLMNIISYIKDNNTEVDYTDIDKIPVNNEFKEQLVERYRRIFTKYEDTVGNKIENKEDICKKMVYYQLMINIPFMKIKNVVMYAAFDDKPVDELIDDLDKLLEE